MHESGLTDTEKSLRMISHVLEHIQRDQRMILAKLDEGDGDDQLLLDSVLIKIKRVAKRIKRLDDAIP